MIKIDDILKAVNDGLKLHPFKDIKTYEVCRLIAREDSEGNEVLRPAIYEGAGSYKFIQDDTNGLTIYHRIISFENEEDLDSGFGRNSLTTESYSIRTVFFGQKNAIEESCEDIDLYLAKDFKNLVPRRINLPDTNRIVVTGINYDKESIKKEEFIEYNSDSVLFTIDIDITIKGIEDCKELSCEPTTFKECEPATILDSDGVTTFKVESGENGDCTLCTAINISNSNNSYDVETLVDLELPNITFTDSDGTPTSVPSMEDLVCTLADTDLILKLWFDIGDDISTINIDSDSAGILTSMIDDGSSGILTVSYDGSPYADFSTYNPLTVVDTKVLQIKRTVTTALGYGKFSGNY